MQLIIWFFDAIIILIVLRVLVSPIKWLQDNNTKQYETKEFEFPKWINKAIFLGIIFIMFIGFISEFIFIAQR